MRNLVLNKSDAAVTFIVWMGMIFSPLIRALEFYTKQPIGLPKGKKQKFNHSIARPR